MLPSIKSTAKRHKFSFSKKVGNYLLSDVIGEGSFAKVRLGLHLPTGEKVAIKIISKNWSDKDSYIKKHLRREAKLLQSFNHPNIMKLYDTMETANRYYLVTEYCPLSITSFMAKHHRLTEEQAKPLIGQLLKAIKYLHEKNTIHRDIKIDNLLLDQNGNLKLIDFGLSNTANIIASEGDIRKLMCRTRCGSPAYAAPELLANLAYTNAVDMWSIGVCLYAMLAGCLPYEVHPFNVKQLQLKIEKGQMNPYPADLSQDCIQLLRKLLVVDPSQRITAAEALVLPWFNDIKNMGNDDIEISSKIPDLKLVKTVASQLKVSAEKVINSVVGAVPCNTAATYHLLMQKRHRNMNLSMAINDKKTCSRPDELNMLYSRMCIQQTKGQREQIVAVGRGQA